MGDGARARRHKKLHKCLAAPQTAGEVLETLIGHLTAKNGRDTRQEVKARELGDAINKNSRHRLKAPEYGRNGTYMTARVPE